MPVVTCNKSLTTSAYLTTTITTKNDFMASLNIFVDQCHPLRHGKIRYMVMQKIFDFFENANGKYEYKLGENCPTWF